MLETAERITLKRRGSLDVTGVQAEGTSTDEQPVSRVTVNLTPVHDFLAAEDDPILAALWDNEDDAIYDDA